ncbi:MAG: YfiR family protein [Geobacter sp.]|nr:MAG: YfiR family protein [Geobacter sp.]
MIPPLLNFWLRLTLLVALAAMAAPVWAESTEAELKAAFIFSFAKYVDWPADALNANPGALTLCLVGGSNDLFDELSEMHGKAIKGRSLQVRTSARSDNLKSCQMLVMADSEADHYASVLRRLDGVPVLTVNGSSNFLDAGGIIGLFAEGKKIRFDINLVAARRNNLVLSSNLLKLARTVRQP